ncbi:MAG: DUF2892 domain-containing protein [Pseudomonadota bacterium]
MRQNVGVLDSTLRVGLGFGLLFVGFLLHPQPASWAAYAGFLILAITGFTGKCLLYRILGITSCAQDAPH